MQEQLPGVISFPIPLRILLASQPHLVMTLRKSLLGWKAYFGIAEVLSPLRDVDKW